MEDAVTGSDMGQEGVPQALARMGSLHQARDVHHIKERWDLAANHKGKTIKTVTGIHLRSLQHNLSAVYEIHPGNSSKDFFFKLVSFKYVLMFLL